MEEKQEFLDGIKKISEDKEMLKAVKLEDSIDYRFELVREEAEQRGILK